MKPLIAIVGRPNVGKSTLFNRLARRKIAVVRQPGITRDRLFADCQIGDRSVTLIDTGGFDMEPDDELARGAADQAQIGH